MKVLSTKLFLLSMFLILASGLGMVYFGYYFLNHRFPDLFNDQEKINNILDGRPVTKKPKNVTLDLSSPENNILVFSQSLLVQGKTTPGAVVLLTSDSNEQILKTNKDGSFSQTIKLSEGVNNLLVSSFDSLGNSQSEQRTIYYSPDKL